LKGLLRAELLGVYLNPDEIEKEMRMHGGLVLSNYRVTISESEAKAFFGRSLFMKEVGLENLEDQVSVVGDHLNFHPSLVNSYVASAVTILLRERLLDARRSFTIETVMSHPSKVALLREAQALGYRTYLYYIATKDPEINISRVKSRVSLGGHDVPQEKIVSRYYASLDLLMAAIRCANRAYIFDNSGEGKQRTWLAEVTEGSEIELKSSSLPMWFFRAILEKNSSPG
jgi:predicted ABC-type ATPase